MIIHGIICGLLAASFQSLSYVFSRIFVVKEGNSPGLLFVLSHVQMGAVAIVALPFVVVGGCPPVRVFFWPLMGAAVFYLAGQAALFKALESAEASRVAPLLALKILVLALITSLVMCKTVTPLQWGAVALSVLAAFILNYSGGSVPLPAVVGILLCCLGYSLSDIYIRFLIDSLESVGKFRAILLGCCMSYVLTGLIGLAMLPGYGRPSREQWKLAVPMSISWLLAMILLFATFKFIGVLLGNIIQSTRGLISVLMGTLIARLGHVHLEKKMGRGVLLRRAVAAALMTAAVALYVMGRPNP